MKTLFSFALFACLLPALAQDKPKADVPEAAAGVPDAVEAAEPKEVLVAEAPEGFSDLPPAIPGRCYIRTKLPARYKTVTEEVVIKPASAEISIVPAVYTQVVRRVMIKEAYSEHRVTPATFADREFREIVRPATFELKTYPPKYEEVEETVIVTPERQVWKRGSGLQGAVNGGEGDLLCLVTLPAETKQVKRMVEIEPARTKKVRVPAKYAVVNRLAVVSTSIVEVVEIPAVYEERKVSLLLMPPQKKIREVPPEVMQVDRQVLEQPERMGWTRVLCDTNLKKPILGDIHDALKEEGYEVEKRGTLEGVVPAIKSFAEKQGIAKGISYELLEKLGVKTPEERADK